MTQVHHIDLFVINCLPYIASQFIEHRYGLGDNDRGSSTLNTMSSTWVHTSFLIPELRITKLRITGSWRRQLNTKFLLYYIEASISLNSSTTLRTVHSLPLAISNSLLFHFTCPFIQSGSAALLTAAASPVTIMSTTLVSAHSNYHHTNTN